MHWVAIVFGWPGALSSIVLSTVGLLFRSAVLVLVGAFVGFPFMYYLFATPRFWLFASVAVPCHFGAAAVLSRRHTLLAWLLFIPTPLATWQVAAAITGRIW